MALYYNEQKERMSLEAFYALIESDPEHRYEYIDGYAYISPHGTPDHSIIGANLTGILCERLRKRPCIVYSSGVYIELVDEENCLRPDVSVSCDRRDYHAKKVIRYPSVIVEVLSPGTKARDRGIKSELYQIFLQCKKCSLSTHKSCAFNSIDAKRTTGPCVTSPKKRQ